MELFFNGYSLTLLFFGSITIALCVYMFNKGGLAVRWFSYVMLASGIWSTAYGFELASSTIKQISFFVNIEYIGITSLPLFWFLFCLTFSGKECWYKKKKNLFTILTFPVVTLVMVWTNPLHHFHYNDISVNNDYSFPMLEINRGIWYYVFTVYFYLLLAAGCYMLVSKFSKSDPIFRKQNYAIIVAAITPWLANASYLLGFRISGLIDVTPFAFIATTLLVLIGIYRFQLFDVIPLAREKALELMNDGVLVMDKNLRIIDANSAALKYLPSSSKRVVGQHLTEVFNNPRLIEQAKSNEDASFELEIRCQTELYIEVDIRHLNENNINEKFTVLKIQDLTASKKDALLSKQQAKELERLNQLKDRIFSIIAHDLRGPLVNVSEVLKLLSTKQLNIEEFSAIAPTLTKQVIYTTDLMENILHWSRSQLKGFGIKREDINVRSIVSNEIAYHAPMAKFKKINLINDVFPHETVYADLLMFQIVMRNILNNAIKFSHENGAIQINAHFLGNNRLQINISDNGVGVAEDKLSSLFADDHYSTRGTANEKGTGLGLAVCKDFIERNYGTIKVDSKLGSGTTFSVTFPTKA